jgi:AAA domain/PLD-like domain
LSCSGKTRTIGTIGEELWKADRSVLLVSHTNAAVDQALLHIGDALGERAEDGSVLRVGAPKDLRLLEQPRLLAETHIRERAEVMESEEADLRTERTQALARLGEVQELIALAAWLPQAQSDITRLEGEADRVGHLAEALEEARLDLARAEEREPTWRERAQAAEAVRGDIAREATLAAAAGKARSRATSARADVAAASGRLREAAELLEKAEAANAMTRRLRGLPRQEEQAAAVRTEQAKVESLRTVGDRAEHELKSLTDELGEVRNRLVGFAATHGDSPDSILAETRRLSEDLSGRRQAAHEAERAFNDLRATVGAEIAEYWALLQSRSLIGEAPASLEDRLNGLREGRDRAAVQLDRLDTADLQTEIGRLNVRVRAIDQRLETIADEKAAIEGAVIADARIVATTLTRAYLRDSIQNRRFDTVILDEASMAPIPALWLAAATAEHNVVVVGDFRQLPPIKHSEHPLAERWLSQDIFEESGVRAAYDANRAPEHLVVLRTQYRMHPQISAIPNELIYHGLLVDGHNTTDDSDLDGWFNREWGPDAPVVLVDTESLNAWVTGVGGSGRTSRLNFLSATVCADLAERMLRADRPELDEGSSRRILIGAPYRPHARLVELLLQDLELDREVVAGTAHTFQGSEAPVVIFDLVNDEPHWRVGMFAPAYDETTRRLLNVALTRPRHRLIIVGDFAYVRSKSRHAFLGRLVEFLEARYPKVDARELVGAGLAARAAKAQLQLVGGPIEPDQQRLVVTQDDFYGLLSRDLAAAAERVVIYSPFMTANRLGQLEPQLKAAVERGTRIYVVTKTLEERGERDQESYVALEAALRSWGIEVLHKRQMHEKLLFVDKRILWSGSLNPLSFSATQEVMERRASERVVADYAQALRVEELLALAASPDRACAICGTELAMAEGPAEPYWRCPSEDCDYTRNIGQSAPRDGLVVCASPGCGKQVKFGFWGDEPRWRCTVNPRHRQRIAKSHLKLPKVRVIVPAQELRKLERRFGLDGQDRAHERRLSGQPGRATRLRGPR